jgi:2-oxoisovalerate dehydrogenase E1 component beta subunit
MELTMAGALNAALRDSMREDDTVVVYGEDVGKLGGVFRITDGLQAEMGTDRCFDTPVAESGIAGTAIGMALYGLRPVVEMQFDGFSYPALNQVISHVAKYRNRTRGRVGLPLVIRIPYGGGIGAVEHHSESPEAYYTHTAGLTVVSPGTPADAYALLRSSIALDDPVIFLEPKRRYWLKEDLDLPVTAPPIGEAIVRRAGTTATVIAYGPMVTTAIEAATRAAVESGWDLEVVDVRTLSPLDMDTLVASATKTVGYGAEIAAELSERAFGYLAAPVLRVTGFDVPYPSAKIERHFLPDADRILDAVARLLEY